MLRQARKRLEDGLTLLFGDPGTLVFQLEADQMIPLQPTAEGNCCAGCTIFTGVVNQISKHLLHGGGIGQHRGQAGGYFRDEL